MTRNEKIAEKMGWIKYFGDEPVITDSGHKVSFQFIRTPDGDIDFDLKIDTQTAHLLIERMVGDGWKITMINWPPIAGQKPFKKFTFYAEKFTDERSFVDFKSEDNDFPSAVVELFCRVNNIVED